MDEFFDTPEQAALAGWPAAAKVHVVRTDPAGPNRVVVVLDTDPSYLYYVTCEHQTEGWLELHSNN